MIGELIPFWRRRRNGSDDSYDFSIMERNPYSFALTPEMEMGLSDQDGLICTALEIEHRVNGFTRHDACLNMAFWGFIFCPDGVKDGYSGQIYAGQKFNENAGYVYNEVLNGCEPAFHVDFRGAVEFKMPTPFPNSLQLRAVCVDQGTGTEFLGESLAEVLNIQTSKPGYKDHDLVLTENEIGECFTEGLKRYRTRQGDVLIFIEEDCPSEFTLVHRETLPSMTVYSDPNTERLRRLRIYDFKCQLA